MQTNPDQDGALMAFQELVERDLLSAVFDHSPTQVFVVDALTLRFVAANPAALRNVAANLPRLRSMKVAELAPALGAERIARILDRVRRRKSRRVAFGMRIDVAMNIRLEVVVLYSDAARPSFMVFVGDVSEPYRAAASAKTTLETAIGSLSDGFVLYDASDRMVLCNAKYREMYRESAPAMMPGATFESILRFGLDRGQYADAKGREQDWLHDRLADHKAMNSEIEQRLSDGRWLRIVERPTPDGGRVGLRVDITKVKQQQQALDNLAHTDDLTGLLNRRGLIDRLAALRAEITTGQRLVLMQVDLDRFKKVNDLSGHEAGDHVLCQSAQRMVGDPTRPVAAARVGADEFIVVMRTRKSDSALLALAQKLVHQLAEPIQYQGQNLHVGASIGLSCLRPDSADAVDDMIFEADIALNLVKDDGGNDARLFEDKMREETQRRSIMAEQMMLGVSRQEFEPYFQPQIDTMSGQVIGFEALIRWIHPVDGLVPAFQFLEVAQRAGLTDVLDDIVMDRSCYAARQLLDWGMAMPRISLNMSIAQISDPSIVVRLERHMRAHNVTCENLRIELLESTLLDKESSQIVRNVHGLIAAGFPVELDDFGTGHAAIATLRKFAVSRIKIDRSLVQNIDRDSELQVITSAIIDLANRLGIGVLAEGVETRLEQRMLTEMGCHRVQGYLHARPMPLASLRRFLKDRKMVA